MNINKSKIILAILLISSFILYCFLIIINVNIENQCVVNPENIHLTWQRDPSTTMTITWQTNCSDEQLTWLENDLFRHQNFTWKLVTYH
jgi:hypothetical protein